MSDVHHPDHYTKGEIECIDGIAAALGLEGVIAYCRGAAMKYIWRCQYKGDTLKDLRKATWYTLRAAAYHELLVQSRLKVDKAPTSTSSGNCVLPPENIYIPDTSKYPSYPETGSHHDQPKPRDLFWSNSGQKPETD